MVNEGITSVKGNASSRKLSTDPIAPNLPPNDFINIKADSGAHITSENSPTNGIEKLAYPIRSIIIQNESDGKDLVCVCWSVFMAFNNQIQCKSAEMTEWQPYNCAHILI